MNRRDFLRPPSISRITGVLASSTGLPEARQTQISTTLLRFARRFMACQFELLLPFGTFNAHSAAAAAFEVLGRMEQRLTVYRPSSPISRLNRIAASEAVPLEGELFELFRLALRITNETEGAFDIATGSLIKAWGFFRGPNRVPDTRTLEKARECAGARHVALDNQARTIRFRRPGVEINLGSIGKGYALDRAADCLRKKWHVSSALLHGGYSSLYAMGTEPASRQGWKVGLAHPWKRGRRIALVELKDRALATSASTYQHFEYQGRKLGHILDPRTGWPAEAMTSVSVVAPTAAEADALATAFFILGSDKAKAYCESHPGIGAVLLREDASVPVAVGLTPREVSVFPA
jgi:FAD:protein FMN transferase